MGIAAVTNLVHYLTQLTVFPLLSLTSLVQPELSLIFSPSPQ